MCTRWARRCIAWVTGHPPFQAATPLETTMQVIEREPVAPRQLNPAVDRARTNLVSPLLEVAAKSPDLRNRSGVLVRMKRIHVEICVEHGRHVDHNDSRSG